jgi:glycosyltransferase involved in cell wall biosynthesis
MPTVSVIVPAYNAERYLSECVESALAQTYADLELVIVDDGSTDGTREIANTLCSRDPRVRVISQDNRGLAGARNTALIAARGQVFALLDSDDVWAPTFLAEQMRMLDGDRRVAIVTGNAFNRGGVWDGLPVRPIVADSRPLDLLEILQDEAAVFIMSVFRREVVDRIGMFDEGFRTNEDYDFWIRAALAGFRFARNPKPLGFYRRHGHSLSSSQSRMLAGILRVYRKTLPSCEAGTAAHDIIVRQIRRFEADLMRAEARDALDRQDADAAATSLNALRLRHGGLLLAIAAGALRFVPRAALWAYRRRRQLRDTAGPRLSGAAAI